VRITTRIFAAGNRSLTRIPLANAAMKDCLDANGKLDPVKAQLAFAVPTTAEYAPFVSDSSDDVCVHYAALTFLKCFHDAYAEVVANDAANCDDHAVTRQDAILVKRMDGGKYVFSRMDIKRTREGVRVRLTYANPHEIVGQAIVEARTYTETCAQMWLRIAKQIPWLTVEADADILADARVKNQAAEDRSKYGGCERRVNGYCSPCQFDCKFYRNGRCAYR